MAAFYFPSADGVSGGGTAGQSRFRLKIEQTYDPSANASSLVITPQVKCSSNLAPNQFQFTAGSISVGGVQVGDLTTASGKLYKPLNSNMNAWVDVGLNGSVLTMRRSVAHNADGTATVAVAFGRVSMMTTTGYYSSFDARSESIPIPAATYTLSISATGCTVTVKHGSTTLSNGASVTYGWTLTITATASTGYNAPTIKVNGATLSGSTYTVAGNVAVVGTATKIAYTLTISQGPNSTIKVLRNGSTLSNGATVYYGDQLAITMTANSGYHLTLATINDAPSSGGSYTVSGNVKVKTVAATNSHTLHLTQGEGTVLTVTRSGTALANNANISTGDVLTVSVSAATGYQDATVQVTGATLSSGTVTVGEADITIVSSAVKQSFTLVLQPGANSSISVMRGSEELHDGDTIYYGDALVISAVPDSGYGILTLTVNGSPFTNGATHVVSAAVTVVTTTEELVGAYLRLAAEWLRYALYINSIVNGWGRYVSYIQTTTGWVKY
jgi:hypothetical protein